MKTSEFFSWPRIFRGAVITAVLFGAIAGTVGWEFGYPADTIVGMAGMIVTAFFVASLICAAMIRLAAKLIEKLTRVS